MKEQVANQHPLLARRMQVIKASPSMAAKKKVDALRAAGRHIVDFTIGEPDLDTPEHIANAAVEAIGHGATKYTPSVGIRELLQAVAGKFERENGLSYSPDQLIVGTGAKQLIYTALAATLDEGDEVIIPAPFWVSYPDMVVLNGGKPVVVESTEQSGFKISAADLERAITDKTKWLLLNSPNNPTGAIYTETEFGQILAVLERHPQIHLMIDEIYEHFSYDSAYVSLASYSEDLNARTLLVNGVSKAYAMTGWRIGYAAGPAYLIKAMTTLISQTTSCASEPSQRAAVAALTQDQSCVREACRIFRERRDIIVPLLNAIPGIACAVPQGAFYVFPSVNGLLGKRTPEGKMLETDLDVVHFLLDSAGVAVLDGSAYGTPGFIRLSFATDLDTIKEGCEKIASVCSQLV
ncbi:pyridoxal phosphate-dependent aminotransferase [Advenella kashmirensis]|uniref:pyridoxal phosphate-dependent aminotransferase n=1 Tax=Advenella kashmirensis TaxID=310575 RepID=UPI0004CEEF98|nr:pyridoxal phosphate-dependent aminotransferase [Advenella kashmirensis]